ncbi:MAG: ATP-dependent 6-phosphofructokinase, partial [Planctomycetaceae bacterium]|nr:ATP-dependent 6-phosphofructokinase [Planctomycetaceae bacterium]
MINAADFIVKTLGSCRVDSPMAPLLAARKQSVNNVDETDRVLFDDIASAAISRAVPAHELPGFEPAGPRKKLYFDPSKTRAGIVTCGGLCPGFNDVIRGLVLELSFRYGVKKIFGFRNGYQGFIARHGHPVMELTPEIVSPINEDGGTILGTSRGQQDPVDIVDCLEQLGINQLFVIGGDGTLRGALAISKEIAERGLKIAVVGVPKTIDNDIMYIDQSFGFQTAFSMATEAIRAGHAEADSSPNGIGLVKVMGRHSGFIACYAALAKNDANFVLIPEVSFRLDGPQGLLTAL